MFQSIETEGINFLIKISRFQDDKMLF